MSSGKWRADAADGPLGNGIYVAVALSSALLVLAVAGYLTHSAQAEETYLPADIASRQESDLRDSSVTATPRTIDGIEVQVAEVDASGGVFEPSQIVVRAGVPVRLVFSEGTRGTDVVEFSEPRVSAKLTRDGLKIDLPPLEAGVYSFGCCNGGASGLVLAE